jgi:hypothetical protein
MNVRLKTNVGEYFIKSCRHEVQYAIDDDADGRAAWWRGYFFSGKTTVEGSP